MLLLGGFHLWHNGGVGSHNEQLIKKCQSPMEAPADDTEQQSITQFYCNFPKGPSCLSLHHYQLN